MTVAGTAGQSRVIQGGTELPSYGGRVELVPVQGEDPLAVDVPVRADLVGEVEGEAAGQWVAAELDRVGRQRRAVVAGRLPPSPSAGLTRIAATATIAATTIRTVATRGARAASDRADGCPRPGRT